MARRIISLIVFALIVNAGARGAMVFFHSEQFKDAVGEIALFGATKTDEVLKANVMDTAAANEIQNVDVDDITITRKSMPGSADKVTIQVSYGFDVALVPGYLRHFDFSYTTR